MALLGIAEYSGVTGRDGTRIVESGALANFTGGAVPANAAEINALAKQVAVDLYRWRLDRQESVFAGIAAYEPEGLSGAVEWRHREGDVSTRFLPHLDCDCGPLMHRSTSGTAEECCDGTITTETTTYHEKPTTFTSTVTIDVDLTTEKSLVITPPPNSTVPVIDIDQDASSTGDIIDISVGGTKVYFVNKDGYLVIANTTAIADGDLPNSSITFFIDATTGLPQFKSKTSGGTVVTGNILTGAGLTDKFLPKFDGTKLVDSIAQQDGARIAITGGLTAVPSAAADVGIISRAHASQTGDLFQAMNNGATDVYIRINKDGQFILTKNAAPADGDLSASELCLWFDDTAGAAKLKIKAKNASGTVVTGEVALA